MGKELVTRTLIGDDPLPTDLLVVTPYQMTHPYNGMELAGGDLFSSLHGSCHFLLVLKVEEWDNLSTDRIQPLCYLRLQW